MTLVKLGARKKMESQEQDDDDDGFSLTDII